MKLFNMYEKALLDCGFKRGISSFYRLPARWKISMPVSTSFEIEIILDGNKELVKVNERSLNWIHDTFVSGKKQVFINFIQSNPDMRVLVSSTERVNEGTDLYKEALKTNVKGMYNLPIRWDKDDTPKLVDQNSQVSNVRHVERYERYSNENKVDAIIVYGTNYTLGLKSSQPFCELSLNIDPSDLQKAITHSMHEGYVDQFARNVFHTSLKIKQKLEEVTITIGDV